MTRMITIDGLRAGYGKLEVLHDIELILTAERFTAILGPNGSGKSTLLKSIFGLTRVFAGSIRLGERELVGLPTEKIARQRIGYVPQRDNIFTAMTVWENLQLAVRTLKATDARPWLDAAFELFPILAKRQRQRASQLSGGERQMVAIAICWLQQPRVMLLDEPSAGLAPIVMNEIFGVLQTLSQQGITLVVVEQNARSILRWCDDVAIMREGQVVFTGTAAQCQADEAMVKEYLGVSIRRSTAPETSL